MIAFSIIISIILILISVVVLIKAINKKKEIIYLSTVNAETINQSASKNAEAIIQIATKNAEKLETEANRSAKNIEDMALTKLKQAEDRIERLKDADIELTERLKQMRAQIELLTDESCRIASDVELINEDDMMSSQEYQQDRKQLKDRILKHAQNAIINVKGYNSNVNIGTFVAISAKADMAGALLLTTVEMLCAKITMNNANQAHVKLKESIVATVALIKAIDSRAEISKEFEALLIERLNVEINFRRAQQIARETQRDIKEQEREERLARQEAERILQEAEREEKIKNKAIIEIEFALLKAHESEKNELMNQLQKLQNDISEVHKMYERAKSRAQETKQGNVYIISNIGSFGKDVLKIGMTRRIDPMDRVKELGDASVPFCFDVHALIESDNAPELESLLHKEFESFRVNKVNRKKEFFNINIEQIEKKLIDLNINALINKIPSADEYYQSIKLRAS